MRKENFAKGAIFHVFNKSIAGYGIFKDLDNGQRFIDALSYYNDKLVEKSFSEFLKTNSNWRSENLLFPKKSAYVKFLCYCVMPDHYHLLVKILENNYFSKYLSDVENSFTRYFNIKFGRKGPLWQTSFKAVAIESNEELLHVSRYIHLNPTTSFLVEKPEDWQFSSYRHFIENFKILKITREISIESPLKYKRFVEDQKDYQRKLKLIKNIILE